MLAIAGAACWMRTRGDSAARLHCHCSDGRGRFLLLRDLICGLFCSRWSSLAVRRVVRDTAGA